MSEVIVWLLFEHFLVIGHGQRDRPAVKPLPSSWCHPDGLQRRVLGNGDFDRGKVVGERSGKAHRYLTAAPGGHGQRRRGAWKISDPQAIPEVRTTAEQRIANL